MRPIPTGLLLLGMIAVATPLAGQVGTLGISVGTAETGWRPALRVDGILEDPAFREALDSGLPLRFRFRLELWEKSLIDRLVGTRESEFALLRDPLEGSYQLSQGRSNRVLTRLADAERVLQSSASTDVRPERRGRYYYLVTLEVETLSLSDLEELQRWIRGEAGPAVQGRRPVGRAVGRGLQRAFVRMIGLPARRYDARTPTFIVE
jgi:hypothetical protein